MTVSLFKNTFDLGRIVVKGGLKHIPDYIPDLRRVNDDDGIAVGCENGIEFRVGTATDEKELAVLQGRVPVHELPLRFRVYLVLGGMDVFRPDIVDGLGLDGKVDVPQLHVLPVRDTDDLVETGVDVHDRVDVGHLVNVLHLPVHPVKRIVEYRFRVEGVLVVAYGIAEQEPPVIVLLKLVRVNRHPGKGLSRILEFPVPETDDLPS